MAFFQMLPQAPQDRLSEQLGQALGSGLGIRSQQQKEKMQQGILSKALQGQASQEELQSLPADVQLKLSDVMQKREAEKRKSDLYNMIFGGGGAGGQAQQAQGAGINQYGGMGQGIGTQGVAQVGMRDEGGLTDEQIAYLSTVDPNLAKVMQSQKESKAKKAIKAAELDRKEQIEFHKESQKFDDKLTSQAESAKKKIKAIEQQKKILPNIKKTDRIISALFSGTKYENLLKSKNAQEFDSLVLPMIEGMREMFGTRLSDADLRIVLQKIATSEKDPNANQAILDWQLLEGKLDVEKRKIADELRRENKGLRPIDYQQQINKRMDEKFGDQIEKEASKIMSLRDDPKMSAKVTERIKVPKGTPLDTKTIDLYLKLSNNNPEEAKKMALEDGYEF